MQPLLAQGDSEDESDNPSVQFEDEEDINCICTSPRALIVQRERAPCQNGRITPRLSLINLPERGMSSPEKPSSSKEKKKSKSQKQKGRKRSKSLSHRDTVSALNSARNLLSPSGNSPNQLIEIAQHIEPDRPRELEESLARLHTVIIIENTIQIHPINVFTHLLGIDIPPETNRTLYSILIEAANRIPNPTIPGQYDRAFLNSLFTLIDNHLKKSLVNDSLQGLAPALLVMALAEFSFNETQANNIDWREIFETRITYIFSEEEGNDTLQALRLFILKYLIHNLQNWESREIKEELLTIAHIFHIQITGHARIDNNPQQELFAHIIASEIYMLLGLIGLPTLESNAYSSLKKAHTLMFI